MNAPKIILLLWLMLINGFCHAQFNEGFSDGEFTNNPMWTGDNAKFLISTGKLKLQAPAVSETAFLSTPSQAIHAANWEFYLQMDFMPSSTNFAKIYLVADQPNLNNSLNGYFVKVGNTTRDVSLYRQNGGTETRIVDGTDDRINVSIVKIKIKVTRSANGVWQLYSDVGPTGIYSSEGAVTDNGITASSFFGIHCTYTSTRSDKFWFDDFIVTGTTVPDTTPPTILAATADTEQQVSLIFSEPLDPFSSQQATNFVFENIGLASTVILLPDQRTVQLNLPTPLTNGVSCSIQVDNVKDLAGNQIAASNVNVMFFQAVPGRNKNIIFTEIFADPSPQVGLPIAEFIEIYNRSADPFDLAGWKLSDGSSVGVFQSQIILPGEYWIITAPASLNLFTGLGKTIGLSNFPTLNNDGDKITLKNQSDATIDSINYNLDWYRSEDKSQGGWTLELIDPENPCGEQDNWAASDDPKGGTPGRKNSVFANKPDLTAPSLLSVFPLSPSRLAITFDEKLDPVSVGKENFKINPQGAISKAFFSDISLKTVLVDLSQNLVGREQYRIDASNIRDCNGNSIQPTSFYFGLPENADSLDIVVNEILFNPRSGGVDFVEIFNPSAKFVNLKNWKLGNYESGVPSNMIMTFAKDVLMPPGGFVVLTPDPLIVKSQYPQSIEKNLFKVQLPSLPDDRGSVVIINDSGNILDAITYSKDWHSEFIKNEEGVSLERVSPLAPSNNPSSWTSTSSRSGFATPGSPNSQLRLTEQIGDGEVLVVPEIFFPGEASNDFVEIQYRFDFTGWVANVKVYNQQGHLVKNIANNETLDQQGFFRWDGDRDDGSEARMGYYVVWFEIFNAEASVRTFRKRVVVAMR